MSTILVVDDEYLIADILGFLLEDEGFEVLKVGNGEMAPACRKALRWPE